MNPLRRLFLISRRTSAPVIRAGRSRGDTTRFLFAIFAAFALMAGIAPAFAQAPPAVPALPDTERRTSYSLTASTCACSVGFALYGDSNDYWNWVEVFVNGVQVQYNDATFGWTITSPTGSLSTIPRPITDAVLTFNSAQTATIQIVGARRPRRVSQFTENRGVAARDLNQVLTDIVAQNRETWDKINDVTGRSVVAVPGETLNTLPPAGTRANNLLGFDGSGQIALYLSQLPVNNQSANTVYAGPSSGSAAAPAFRALVGNDLPTFTGDVLHSGAAMTIQPGVVSNSKLATMNAFTLKLNATGSTAAPTDTTIPGLTSKSTPVGADQIMIADSAAGGALKQSTLSAAIGSLASGVAQIDAQTGNFTTGNGIDSSGKVIEMTAARRTLPTTQTFTTGTAQTYTTPANVQWLEVKMCGGGAGGAGSGGSGATVGTSGGDTTFATFTAGKGLAPAAQASAGSGGTPTGGYLNQIGGNGGPGSGSTTANPGGSGGASAYGGPGSGGAAGAGPGSAASVNSCSGGGGGGVNSTANGGGGGGAGAYLEGIINSPASTYTYTVGSGGTGGSAGTGGATGGNGAAGRITVIEHYNS